MRPSVLCCMALLAIPLHGSEEDPDLRLRLDRFRQLEALIGLVEREYARPIDRNRLWDGAMRGMIAELDPHSHYQGDESLALHAPDGTGEAMGFGFDWQYDPLVGAMVVRRVVHGSSAWQAGMVAGDLLVAVDGTALTGVPPQQAAEALSRAGDETTIAVHHADDSREPLILVRSPYADDGVVAVTMLSGPPALGYVRISRFIGTAEEDATAITANRVRSGIQNLLDQGMEGLVLDLRGNGGGSLPAAVAVADCFLSGSEQVPTTIVTQVGRTPARQGQWLAHGHNTLPPVPIAILVDGGTASAAEVLAGALRQHRRAVLVGAQTSGKDTVQQTFLLEDGGAVRLTVARYLLPDGNSLDGVGLVPDVHVDEDPLTAYRRARAERASALGETAPAAAIAVTDQALERGQELLRTVLLLGR